MTDALLILAVVGIWLNLMVNVTRSRQEFNREVSEEVRKLKESAGKLKQAVESNKES